MAEHQMSRSPPNDQSVSQSKRTLLKAGWVAPVVVVLTLPAISFDANASGRPPGVGGGPPFPVPPGGPPFGKPGGRTG